VPELDAPDPPGPELVVPDPLGEELVDAMAGAEASGPEDPLEQLDTTSARAANTHAAATRIGPVCRSVLKSSLCALPDRLLSRADRAP